MKRAVKKVLRGGNLQTRAALYEGGDHLLYVEGYYTEKVRRFYYRDIQAALWTRHRAAFWIRVLLMVLGGIPGLILLASGNPEAALFFLLPSLLVLIRILYVSSKGGYCRFCLVTAAQGTRIVGAHTVIKAIKLVDHIQQRVGDPEA